MIIDTTCSVIERKMKEVDEVPKSQTFKVSDFVVTIATAMQNCHTFTSNSGWTNVTYVTFKNCVTYNMPNKVMDWDAPVSKVDPDIADIQRQLAATTGDPNMVMNTGHTLAGLENDDHLQYFLNS